MARSLSSIHHRLTAGEATVAGVLSGTSADGIDVALVRFEAWTGGDLGRPDVLLFRTEPWPAERDLPRRVREVLDGRAQSLAELALLDRDLGLAFGRAARAVAAAACERLDLVGSHGQTVFHHDGGAERATLQLGDADHVAEAAGCPVVSDFRQRDLAAGGEGAPIAALVDDLCYPDLPRPGAILNLGGIANLTFLSTRHGARDAELLSFDVGPAGSLLDGLARRLLHRPFDAGGAQALLGDADPRWVARHLAHPFFDRPPPKSTGRDTFGEAWVSDAIASARSLGLGPHDALASAVELVAASVGEALDRWVAQRPRAIAVAGGGVHNRALLAALERRLPRVPRPAGAWGIDADAREAVAFAALAASAVLGIPRTRTAATGAAEGRVLGRLAFG